MTETAPDGLALWLEMLHFPGAEPMIAVDCTFIGEEDAGRELMRAVDELPAPLADTRTMMSAAELGQITAEPTDPGPVERGPSCSPPSMTLRSMRSWVSRSLRS